MLNLSEYTDLFDYIRDNISDDNERATILTELTNYYEVE